MYDRGLEGLSTSIYVYCASQGCLIFMKQMHIYVPIPTLIFKSSRMAGQLMR
jgi:hypothetical protein